MKSTILTITLIIISITTVQAQNNAFEIEIDPLAYSIGGASGHVAYTWKNERVQLGFGQLTIPEAMANRENVTESFKAISLKWDYFFGQDNPNHGFFAGPTVDYLFLNYEDENSNSFDESQFNLGIRAGYKFDVFNSNPSLSNIYVTPWVGVSFFTNSDDIELGGQSYSREGMTIFPTVHIGWRF